jgi:hypothetical protein
MHDFLDLIENQFFEILYKNDIKTCMQLRLTDDGAQLIL